MKAQRFQLLLFVETKVQQLLEMGLSYVQVAGFVVAICHPPQILSLLLAVSLSSCQLQLCAGKHEAIGTRSFLEQIIAVTMQLAEPIRRASKACSGEVHENE